MKNPLRAACVFTYFVFSILLVRTNMEAQAVADAHVQEVTAAEYCNFLNNTATTDPDHLYDDAMSTDPETACIVRYGAPGCYHYDVIAGRENFPVTYVSLLDEENYAVNEGCSLFNEDENRDASLKSSVRSFALDVPVASMLTLAIKEKTSRFLEGLGAFDDFAVAVFVAGCMVVGGDGAFAGEAQGARLEQPALSVADFQAAALEYPTATRFVLHEEGGVTSIVPQEADPAALGRNRSENIAITQAHRAALEREYSEEVVQRVLPANHQMSFRRPPLGAAQLNDFFQRVHEARAARAAEAIPVEVRADQTKGVISGERVAPPIESTKEPLLAGPSLTRAALFQCLNNSVLNAENRLAELRNDAAAAAQSGDQKVAKSWAEVIPTAERWVQYIKNCKGNEERRDFHAAELAAVDRAEEAVRLRIKAARNAINQQDRQNFSQAANEMETAAKYMVNAFLAERAGNKEFCDYWKSQSVKCKINADFLNEKSDVIEKIVKDIAQALVKENHGLAKRYIQTRDYYINKTKDINKPEVADYWNRAAVISSQAAGATAKNKDDAAVYYSQAATYLQEAAVEKKNRDAVEVLNAWSQASVYSYMAGEAIIRDRIYDKPLAALCVQVATAYKKAAESIDKTNLDYWTKVAKETFEAAAIISADKPSLKPLSESEFTNQISVYSFKNKDRKKKFTQPVRALWGKASKASTEALTIQKDNDNPIFKTEVFLTRRGNRKIKVLGHQKRKEEINEAAAYYTQAAIYYKNAAEVQTLNKFDEGRYWEDAGDLFTKKAEQEKRRTNYYKESDSAFKKADSFASTSNSTSSYKASYWDWIKCSYVSAGNALSEELEAPYVKAVEEFKKAVEAVDKNNLQDSIHAAVKGKEFFVRARSAEYKARASDVEKNEKPPMVAKEWRAAAAQHDQSSEFYAEAAKAYTEEKTDEGDILNEAGDAFFYAAENLEKALTLEADGDQGGSKKWLNIAELNVKSGEYLAKAHGERETAEGDSWHKAAKSFSNAAENLERVLEAIQEENLEPFDEYKKIPKQWQQSGEYFALAAEAHAAAKTTEGDSWHKAANSCSNAAENLERALEASQEETLERFDKYEEIAQQWQHSSQLFTRAAEAYVAGKKEEGDGWQAAGNCLLTAIEKFDEKRKATLEGSANKSQVLDNAGISFSRAASKLEKKQEVVISNKTEETVNKVNKKLIANLNEEALLYQESGEHFILAATAYADKKSTLAKQLERVAQLFFKAAMASAKSENEDYCKAKKTFDLAARYQKKAIEAEQGENSRLPECLREISLFIEEGARFYIKAANAHAEGKTKESSSWRNAAKCKGRILSCEEAMKAEKEEKLELAEKWRQVASLMKERSEKYDLAAKEHAEGDDKKGDLLDKEGKILAEREEAAFLLQKEAIATAPHIPVNNPATIDTAINSQANDGTVSLTINGK